MQSGSCFIIPGLWDSVVLLATFEAASTHLRGDNEGNFFMIPTPELRPVLIFSEQMCV